jgi:hypothetical protein
LITNVGKNIIAKYFLGHTSSYASHIAIGCGPKALPSDFQFTSSDFENKTTLDFEMFRVPIVSRGYVRENDMTYVVLTGELPTAERYGITEMGIFSAGSNPEAGEADGKIIRSFSELENWEEHNENFASSIPTIFENIGNEDNTIVIENSFFRISSDNPLFLGEGRIAANEVPRFLDSSIVARGDSSLINLDAGTGTLTADDTESSHIHLTGVSLNLDQNAPTDELRLAFSLIYTDADINNDPEEVRILLEFASAESGDVQAAFMEVRLVDGEDGVDFSENRYFVISQQLQELRKTIGFSWNQVNLIKAYASVIVEDEGEESTSSNHYIAYDGIRLENVTSVNPLYGMTGYSVVKNTSALPIVKSPNSSSFVEFRFAFQLEDPVAES